MTVNRTAGSRGGQSRRPGGVKWMNLVQKVGLNLQDESGKGVAGGRRSARSFRPSENPGNPPRGRRRAIVQG